MVLLNIKAGQAVALCNVKPVQVLSSLYCLLSLQVKYIFNVDLQ